MNSNKKHLLKVLALHGFLGKPDDWNTFDPVVSNPVSLKNDDLSFRQWAAQFNQSLVPEDEKNILLGYSLGGRLAMHLLIDNPALWSGAVLVSAHPGLISLEERTKRIEADRIWADRFLHDPWDLLMRDWNKNPVFAGRAFPSLRLENEFNRLSLARQLVNWSLGAQEALLPQLESLKMPILFLAGEIDQKFIPIAKSFESFAQVHVISGASHRVPWDRPDLFENVVKSFIERIQ